MPNTAPDSVRRARAGDEADVMHVAAGVLFDGNGRVLISKRADHSHQGGLWELPGGKLEPGEAPMDALRRELLEELGVRIDAARPLIRIRHDYDDRRILLDVFRIESYDGEPRACEGQPLAWVAPWDMDGTLFPSADRPVINALRLPSLYLITGDDPSEETLFLARLVQALSAGIRLVQLRAHALSDRKFALLARRAYPICRAAGARLVLNRDPSVAASLPCDGIHLTADALRRLHQRPRARGRLVGASCHNEEELAQAGDLGLDYALLSPVQGTSTHPSAAALGWPRFAELAMAARLPVYALGGMTRTHVEQAIDQGGQGIAAIRGLWPASASSVSSRKPTMR
jgi:8-oxo-dGTP diphosphatase